MASAPRATQTGAAQASAVVESLARFWDALHALVLLGLLLFILRHPLVINHDCAVPLNAAQLLLEGQMPYVDFAELNPPLIIYVNVVPAALAAAVGVNPIPVFSLLVWLLAVLSAWATRRMLRAACPEAERADASALALLLTLVSVYLIRPWDIDFGQREHLFALAFFPFLALRWARCAGGPVGLSTAVAIGLMAGLLACLKPHLLAVLVGVEVYWALSQRSVRVWLKPEVIAAACVGLAYGVHFLLLPQPMREAFFGRWVPLIQRGYAAYNCSVKAALTRGSVPAIILLGVVPFVLRARGSSHLWTLSRPLGVMTLAATLGYLAQRKGFEYHVIPSMYGAVVILGLVALQLRRCVLWKGEEGDAPFRLVVARRPVGVVLLGAAAVGCLAVGGRLLRQGPAPLEPNELRTLISAHSRERDPILMVSTSAFPAQPLLLQMNRRPGSRYYSTLFPIPMLYYGVRRCEGERFPYRTSDLAPPEETRFLRELAEDIARIRPRLILIDDGGHSQGCPVGFNLLDYLVTVGFVAHAMADYQLLTAFRSGDDSLSVFTENPLSHRVGAPP